MLTKRCCDCRLAKRVELFDIDRKRSEGRSAQCKDCRRQRQNRGGHPEEYDHHREKARIELAPDSAPAQVWDRARSFALAEIARRHPDDWHRRYQQVCAAHPDWGKGRRYCVATNQYRRAHRDELTELMSTYAAAKPAGPRLVYKIGRRAQRLLQLAHPKEYEALYAAERAKVGNPVRRREVMFERVATRPGR